MGDPISIRLEPEVKTAVQELAEADERSMSSYINRVLRTHVEAMKKRQKAKG